MSRKSDSDLVVLRVLADRVDDVRADVQQHRDALLDLERLLDAGADVTALEPRFRAPEARGNDWASMVAWATADLRARNVEIEQLTASDLCIRLDALPADNAMLMRLGARDFALAVLTGLAGALTALTLEPVLEIVHDGKYVERIAGWLGGPDFTQALLDRLPLDIVPGRANYGGFWHRLEFGHDILNPFEAWEQMRQHFGGPVAAALGFIIHWAGDALSVEGLPLPGSSWVRPLIKQLSLGNLQNYQQFFTLKGRDLVGGALVTAVSNRYCAYNRMGSASGFLDYQFPLLAHAVCAAVGCYLGSLNWYSVSAVGTNFLKLAWHVHKVQTWLDRRDAEIWERVTRAPDTGPPLSAMLSELDGWDHQERAWLVVPPHSMESAAGRMGLRVVDGGLTLRRSSNHG